MERAAHEADRAALLFVLTGDSRHLPDSLRPVRKRTKVMKLEGKTPESLETPKRFKRTNPANPYMDEARAWTRHHSDGTHRSHSNKIEEYAKRSMYFRILSNRQSTFTGAHRQSPCHRDFSDEERTGKTSPKVGPQN